MANYLLIYLVFLKLFQIFHIHVYFSNQSASRSTESSETRCWPFSQPSMPLIRNVLLHRTPGEEGFGFVLASPAGSSKSLASKRHGDHSICKSFSMSFFVERV